MDDDEKFSEGDRVVLNGYGLSESHFGGYSEKARVNSDYLLRLPENISNKLELKNYEKAYFRPQLILSDNLNLINMRRDFQRYSAWHF